MTLVTLVSLITLITLISFLMLSFLSVSSLFPCPYSHAYDGFQGSYAADYHEHAGAAHYAVVAYDEPVELPVGPERVELFPPFARCYGCRGAAVEV